MPHLLTGRIEAFDVEMGNSSSELIDYFLKRSPSEKVKDKSQSSE
jgi:biopolymer transport protein ExbB/biopolymer transport protein TolQ